MRDKEKDAAEMTVRKEKMMETAFRLFSENGIEQVSMQRIADACGYGIATLYRYFSTKLKLVIAVGSRQWETVFDEIEERKLQYDFDSMTAKEQFEFFLDCFLYLYDSHPDLLRFNQFFNIYLHGEQPSSEELASYFEITRRIADRFHSTYRKGMEENLFRSGITETGMMTAILHLMLAAVTRYAVGLVYLPEGSENPRKELSTLKNMIIREYTR